MKIVPHLYGCMHCNRRVVRLKGPPTQPGLLSQGKRTHVPDGLQITHLPRQIKIKG